MSRYPPAGPYPNQPFHVPYPVQGYPRQPYPTSPPQMYPMAQQPIPPPDKNPYQDYLGYPVRTGMPPPQGCPPPPYSTFLQSPQYSSYAAGGAQPYSTNGPVLMPVESAVFDSGARFDGTARPSVPPPPPGVLPTQAQFAASQGQSVMMTQRKDGWFAGNPGEDTQCGE